jgi:DNA-binding transcriptional LysR family regulator
MEAKMLAVTIRQLEYFVAIAEEGTLAAAAQRLHLTAGTLSAAISALERTVGVQLLMRRRATGSVLTTAGRDLEVQARAVLSAAEAMESSASAIRGELSGTLSIGCFDTLTPWLLPPVLGHFADHHPGVQVEVHEGSSDELQQLLLTGRLDAAFMYQLHVDTDVERTTVAPVRLQLVLPEGHRLADRPQVQFAELGDEPAVLLGLKPAPDLIMSMMASAGFTPRVQWRLRNVEAIRSLVGRGLGYSVIMGRPRGDVTYEGERLVYRQIADELPENSVQLVHPPGALGNAKVRELRRFALAELGEIGAPMQHWT